MAALKADLPANPAWFHNLMADPETTVQIGATVREVRARVAGEVERVRLWQRLVESFSAFDFYERNAKGRQIPVVVLEPR